MPSPDLPDEIEHGGSGSVITFAPARLTQEAVAELAGVDRKLISRIELAQVSPRLDAVVRIAGSPNTTTAQLVSLG